MKKEWKDKWVAALRSGEYEQGRGVLRSEHNKFCCLGVLCDIVNKELGVGEWKESEGGRCYIFNSGNGINATNLPLSIQEITGVVSNNGRFRHENGFEDALTVLNDVMKYSFIDIANVIDEYWEKL